MSNCTGCKHAFGDLANPHEKECEICIRNPKYPTKKMPETAIVDDIELTVPQDMYISRDRASFEQKRLMQRIADILRSTVPKQRKEEKIEPKFPRMKYRPPPSPWDWYYEWVKHQKRKG